MARCVPPPSLVVASLLAMAAGCDRPAEPRPAPTPEPAPTATSPAPRGDGLIFQIGSERMTEARFRAHIARQDPFLRARMRGRRFRRDYAEKMIRLELFAHAALGRGLDQQSGAKRVRKEAMVQLLREALYAEHGARPQDVRPDVIEAYLNEHPRLRPEQGVAEPDDAFQERRRKALLKVRDVILREQRSALMEQTTERLYRDAEVHLYPERLDKLRLPAPPQGG